MIPQDSVRADDVESSTDQLPTCQDVLQAFKTQTQMGDAYYAVNDDRLAFAVNEACSDITQHSIGTFSGKGRVFGHS